MTKSMAAVLGELWDQGNCTGLDGWIGPGRGSIEVDDVALDDRRRDVEKAAAALSAAGYGLVADAQARAYDKGYGHGRHDGTYHPPFSGNPRPPKSRRNPYRKAGNDDQ